MSETRRPINSPVPIDLNTASFQEWQTVWNKLPPFMPDDDALADWTQFLSVRPTLEQVRIRRSHMGIPIRQINLDDLNTVPSFEVVRHVAGRNPRIVKSMMYPALFYSFTPDGRLVTLADDHIGATQTRLTQYLGVLDGHEAPYSSVCLDAHHDRGYFHNGTTTLDALIRQEYTVWRKILEGNGIVRDDPSMEWWLNDVSTIERAGAVYKNKPLDLCFLDMDLFIPAHTPGNHSLAVNIPFVEQPFNTLLHAAKAIHISTSTGEFSDQNHVSTMLGLIKKLL